MEIRTSGALGKVAVPVFPEHPQAKRIRAKKGIRHELTKELYGGGSGRLEPSSRPGMTSGGGRRYRRFTSGPVLYVESRNPCKL